MASSELKARKARKHNFSLSEIAVLTEKIEENLTVLQSNLTNSITNQRENEIWREITAAVKAERCWWGEKWKNLHSAAKREFSGYPTETKKTSGGHGNRLLWPRIKSERCLKKRLHLLASNFLRQQLAAGTWGSIQFIDAANARDTFATTREMVDLSTPTVSPTTCRKLPLV